MRQRAGIVLRCVAALLVVAGVVAYVLMDRRTKQLTDQEAAGKAASRAASATLPQLLGYTAAGLTDQLKTSRKLMTASYATRYQKMVLPQVTKFDVANELDIVSTAVVRTSESRAVVLVFANQTTRTKAKPPGVTQGTRLEVVLRRQGTSWLVDAIKPV